jgi:import inner membrane translocase subunit TIM21
MPHHLLKPYSFTHTPSSSSTTRHSSPIQIQHTRNPQTQNEHLIMRFWVHGRGIDEVETLGWIKQPLREARGWVEAQYENLREQYLMDRLDDAAGGDDSPSPSNEPVAQEGGWFGGMFGALKPNVQGSVRGGPSGGRKALPPPGTYTSGEARADFVKVCSFPLLFPIQG